MINYKFTKPCIWVCFLFILLYSTQKSNGQVAINTDNSDPDESAMLDVKSVEKGVLVPRMTTGQRTTISSPAVGLLVFDTVTESFWFMDAVGWVELVSGNVKELADDDGDTKVQVEESVNEDIIRFDLAGAERMVLSGPLGTQLLLNGTLNINNAFSFPTTDGAAWQVMETDGSGVLSWNDKTQAQFVHHPMKALVLPNITQVDLANDDFVFGSDSLNFDVGDPNKDARFFFDKDLGAFRAGETSDDYWDDAYRGLNSFAAGYNTEASGETSVSMGENNIAEGESAVALGEDNVAAGEGSFAAGDDNWAIGNYSISMGKNNCALVDSSTAIGTYNLADALLTTAIGFGNEATDTWATAIGSESWATASGASAFGEITEANGISSSAFGSGAIANGDASTSIGYDATSEGFGSVAIGFEPIAEGDFSQAFGNFTTAYSAFETVFGYYNTDYTPTSTTFPVPTDRLFVVGNGMEPLPPFGLGPSDAFIIYKNGSTFINGPLTLAISGSPLPGITIPNFDGTDGQVLATDGAGTLSWTDVSSLIPPPPFQGSDTKSLWSSDRENGKITVKGNFETDGTAKIGAAGSVLNSIITHNERYDMPRVGSHDPFVTTFIVTGATTESTVHVSPMEELPDCLLVAQAFVSAANIVTVKFINQGNSSVDPVSMTYRFTVINH